MLLRTTACGVSSSSPAIRSGSIAKTKSSGRPSALARAARQDCASSGVSARGRRQPRLAGAADPVPARFGERRERLGETVDEAVDAGRIGQAREQLCRRCRPRVRRRGRTPQRPRRRARCAFPPWPRRAVARPRRGRRRAAAARWVSASAAACRKTSSRAAAILAASASAALRSAIACLFAASASSSSFAAAARRSSMIADHRAEQEPAQNPDEDEDVDRLQGQRPPVDPHRGLPI